VIQLPYPPSVNRLYRSINGRSILSKVGREYYAKAVPIAEASGINLRGPYVLILRAHRPDKRRRDVGNLEKVCSDVLVKSGVVEDDSYAQAILSSWADSAVQLVCSIQHGTDVPILHVELGAPNASKV
jgi:crossover junction endodeoxyribonuclease RusA